MDPTQGSQAPAQTPPAAPATPPAVQTPPVEPTPPAQVPAPPPAAAAPVVPPPAEVELVLPKDVQIDPAVLSDFKALAKEAGLTAKQAQAQVDFYLKLNQKTIEANKASFANWRKQNEAALRADPDFGKDFEASKAVAQRPLAKYGDPELAKELAESGWGDHPRLVKFLHKIGKAMGEDGTPRPNPTSPVIDDPQTKALKQRFPSMFPKQDTADT